MQLDASLAQLENVYLIRRVGEEEATYIFKHVLTQNTAYQSLLHTQRRAIHRHVAHAYEAQYGNRCLDEYAAILAQHYAQAGDDEQALIYATRAGDLAARTYANAEAITFYTLAINIAVQRTNNTTQLIHLYTRRGRAYELAPDYPRAIENYQELQTIAQTRSDRALELESLTLQSTAYAVGLGMRDLQKAQVLSTEALSLAYELGDRRAEARIYWNLLLINRFGNEGPQKAIEYGEKSLALARELNLKEQIALTLKDLATAYISMGRISSARNNLPELLALWRELDNKPMLAEVLGGATSGHLAQGDLEQARLAGEESLALNRSIDNRYGLTVTASFLWYIYREQGELQSAIELVEESLALSGELDYIGPQWAAGVELADTFVYLGAFERAEECVRRAVATADYFPSAHPNYPNAVLARLQLRQGNRDAAEKTLAPFPLETVETLLRAIPSPIASFTIISAYAELALAQGDADRANMITDDLISSLNRIGFVILLPSALHLKGKVLRMLNHTDEAYSLLIDACQQAESMQLRYRLLPILFTLIEMESERGDADAANKVRTQAREIIEYIVAHTPSELRASFLNLLDVRNVMGN